MKKWPDSTTEKQASFKDITTYNNFYEFGTDKGDPAVQRAHAEDAAVDGAKSTGECGKPGTLTHRDILKPHALEERVYRHALRRGLVDGDSVGRLPARRL